MDEDPLPQSAQRPWAFLTEAGPPSHTHAHTPFPLHPPTPTPPLLTLSFAPHTRGNSEYWPHPWNGAEDTEGWYQRAVLGQGSNIVLAALTKVVCQQLT